MSAFYKNVVGNRHAAWCVITSVEQKETSKGVEQLASYAREYVKVEGELQKIRDGILALMDENDPYRYLAEFARGEARNKAVEDTHVSQVVEQVTELPKTLSRDRTLQCTVEQFLDVFVSEMVKQLVEVPKTISQDRIQQQNLEQIVDTPVPQVVEELAEVSKVFSQDGVQQRSVEQTIETPAISLALKCLSLRREKRRNRLRTRMFSTSSTQSKRRCPRSSRRQCMVRNPSPRKRSTR